MNHDFLLDIGTNKAKLVASLRYEKYSFERIQDRDYISCDGCLKTSKREFLEGDTYSDNSILVEFLNIGYFFHNEITKDFQGVYIHKDRMKNSPLYENLIEKIINFCYKFGTFKQLEFNLSDREFNRKMEVNEFIRMASRIYLDYKNLTEDNESIYSYPLSFGTTLSERLEITKDEKGNRKIFLSYEFDEIFDLAKHQLYIYTMSKKNEKYIGLCPYCNTFFESDRKKIYCCKSHANMMSANKNSKIYEKVKCCKSCNTPFEPNHQKQEYCSNKCKRKEDNQRSKERLNK